MQLLFAMFDTSKHQNKVLQYDTTKQPNRTRRSVAQNTIYNKHYSYFLSPRFFVSQWFVQQPHCTCATRNRFKIESINESTCSTY